MIIIIVVTVLAFISALILIKQVNKMIDNMLKDIF